MQKYQKFADKYLDVVTANDVEAMVRCLFHNESNASMQFNLETGLYICFGCKSAGNIRTIEKHLGLVSGVYLDDVSDVRKKLKALKESNVPGEKILDDSELKRFKFPTKYWEDRGFTPETVEMFELGNSPISDDYGKFVTIPLRNDRGELLGVIKRYLGENVELRYRYPKGFKRSINLFASWKVAEDQDIDTVILTEGSIDAIKCWQAGYPALAIYGSSVSSKQIAALKELGIKNVVLFFDNDKAGKECESGCLGFKKRKRGADTKITYDRDHDLTRSFLLYRTRYPRDFPSDPGDMSTKQIRHMVRRAKRYSKMK